MSLDIFVIKLKSKQLKNTISVFKLKKYQLNVIFFITNCVSSKLQKLFILQYISLNKTRICLFLSIIKYYKINYR